MQGDRMVEGKPAGQINSERKMYKTKCTECGLDCEVPFEPKEGRPVKCGDCFKKNRRPMKGRFQKRSFKTTCTKCKKDCEVPFKPREGKPVLCKDCFGKSREN